MRALSVAVLYALGGCAGAGVDSADRDAAELAATLSGRSAGSPQRCISLSSVDGPQIAGSALVYRDGPRLWVSHPVGGCPSLHGDPITVVEVQGGQLCENDRFRTLPRGGATIPGPYCRFGPFTPYARN